MNTRQKLPLLLRYNFLRPYLTVTLLIIVANLCTPLIVLASGNRYIAPIGSDENNDCTNLAAPCATLSYAVSQANAGDAVHLATGTYTETSIILDKALTLVGENRDQTIIQAHEDPLLAANSVFTITASVTIKNLTIQHGNHPENFGSIYVLYPGDLTLHKTNVQYNVGHAIYVDSGTLTLESSRVSHNSGEAIFLGDGDAFLNHSIINNNGGDGIYGMGAEVVIHNSIFRENSGAAISGMGSTIEVSSSTIESNGKGINGEAVNSIYISRSRIIGNTGGGVSNSDDGSLNISYSTISHNGGGVFNGDGNAYIVHSIITRNAGSGIVHDNNGVYLTLMDSVITYNAGVGIDIWQARATISRVTIAGNKNRGLYIDTEAVVTILDSTISKNQTTSNGGGIYNRGVLSIHNSTISGNSAVSNGGGIYNAEQSTLNLNNTTITGNWADFNRDGIGDGGGVYIVTNANSFLYMKNSILAGNYDSLSGAQHPDCWGLLTSQDYNLIEKVTGCTIVGETGHNILSLSPQLGQLINNGGPTKTHALLSGSPAINSGNPAVPGSGGNACVVADQRGELRDAFCDMGAYEMK